MLAGRDLAVLPANRADCPSRVFAQPIRLQVGQGLDAATFAQLLVGIGYRPADARLDRGTFRNTENTLAVMLRPWPVRRSDGVREGVRRLDLVLEDGRIAILLVDGDRSKAPEPVALPLLATLYSDDLIECGSVDLATLPDHVRLAVTAAEDASFYEHEGVSLPAIARSAWANAANGAVVQGGSTITQQLVKNLYLTPERSLSRKGREAFLALALERRHGKDEILASYLNHAYWGRRGAIQLVGIEAGARGWFAKEAAELDLAEAALLAAMLGSPGSYDPVAHPVRARHRRDWVLGRMRQKGWITSGEHDLACARPLTIAARRIDRRVAPYFVQRVKARVERELGISLRGGGYEVLTTLRYADQAVAEAVLADGLSRLQKGEVPLQAALVSIEPATGAVLSYVGGRDFGESEFDRAGVADRQLGSTFKPFVYAAAFESGVVSPADIVYDDPLLIAYGREYWMPGNDGGDYEGPVTVQIALERSLNVPTVRVALATGIDLVRDLAARAGLLSPTAEAVPSLALGAAEASALDLARAYSVFATDGNMPQANGLVAVIRDGKPVHVFSPAEPVRLMTASTARRVTRILQEVVLRGTAASMWRHGLRDPVAGKTGTSDDLHDAWFAGYSPDRVTVVWVGRDDGRNAGYYGSQAALPLWTRYMLGVRPDAGYRNWDYRGDDASGRSTSSAAPEALVESVLRPDRGEWTVVVPMADALVEDPAVRQTLFLERINLWRDRSLLTGATRIFEVPTWFHLPCAKPGQASIKGNPCVG